MQWAHDYYACCYFSSTQDTRGLVKVWLAPAAVVSWIAQVFWDKTAVTHVLVPSSQISVPNLRQRHSKEIYIRPKLTLWG